MRCKLNIACCRHLDADFICFKTQERHGIALFTELERGGGFSTARPFQRKIQALPSSELPLPPLSLIRAVRLCKGTSRSLRFNVEALRGTVAGSFAGHLKCLHHANHSYTSPFLSKHSGIPGHYQMDSMGKNQVNSMLETQIDDRGHLLLTLEALVQSLPPKQTKRKQMFRKQSVNYRKTCLVKLP